jgi:hypothetical protein
LPKSLSFIIVIFYNAILFRFDPAAAYFLRLQALHEAHLEQSPQQRCLCRTLYRIAKKSSTATTARIMKSAIFIEISFYTVIP